MGTQPTGTSATTRQAYVVVGAVLVAIFAGLLHLSGADGAEVVATMLFAVVFGAALLGGRVAGFAAALAATALYAYLRRDAADDAGAARLAVVVLGRAASYVVLAYVTDMMRNRLPRLPLLAAGGTAARSSAGATAVEGRDGGLNEAGAAFAEPAYVDDGPRDVGSAGSGYGAPGYADSGFGPPLPADGASWPGPGAGVNGDYLQDDPYGPAPLGAPTQAVPSADGWDGAGVDQWGAEQWAGDASNGGWAAEPSSPEVPSGWLQEGDHGDEIPVGYTGELFLQDLQGPVPEEPGGPGGDIPMIDGMPFGQPMEERGAAPGPWGGYEAQGYETQAYETQGYDAQGYDAQGYDAHGYDQQGYAPGGYDAGGQVGYDQVGYDSAGYDSAGYDSAGYDSAGYDSAGYDSAGYASAGYDSAGYASAGYGEHGPGQQGHESQVHHGHHYDPVDHTGQAAGPAEEPAAPAVHIDPETRLWTAGYFRDRLALEYEQSHATGGGFSVVMIQIPDTPFQTLSYRRQVALLRELGHQFIRAQVVDHLVHLPDGNHHWFAAVLSGMDRSGAHAFERRLRSAIAGYLRNRGLGLDDIQSATLTSPDDDATMSEIWSSLLVP